ncbi:HEAT repeat domain-containing protein [Spirochaetia bacterium 38H-sp]|uniref:HEAT repeat domain-containing protein n=1 Tax=Rarispira pelagica TaxID=3141764 RepID=A0ABU9UBY2_9SPIR
MGKIWQISQTTSLIIIATITVILILTVTLLIIIRNKKQKQYFINIVEEFSSTADLLREKIVEKFSPSNLIRLLPLIEELAEEKALPLITLSGMDSFLYRKLISGGNYKTFDLVRRHAVETSMYACFYYALKNPKMIEHLFSHPDYSDIEIMRFIALTWDRTPFDTKKAFYLLQDRINLITELTADQQSQCRLFASSILVNSPEERITRLLLQMVEDPDYNVRKIIISNLPSNILKEKIESILAEDPSCEVREEAWKKLTKEEREAFLDKNITDQHALHILRLLNPTDKNHQEFALRCLKSPNEELAFYAAHFLCKQPGSILDYIFIKADSRDRDGFKEAETILTKAAGYQATAFLNSVARIENTDTILLALKILREKGEKKHILTITRKLIAASVWEKNPRTYRELIKTILARRDEISLLHIKKFLKSNKNNHQLINATLELLDKNTVNLVSDLLSELFLDPKYKKRKKLEELLSMEEKSILLPLLLETIEDKGKPLILKKSAIRVLALQKLPYCIGLLLEELPTLSQEEAVELTNILSQYPEEAIAPEIETYINTYDARMVSTLIAALPVEYKKKYNKKIEEKMSSPDPMVRIAAAYSIAEIADNKQLQNMETLLHDPDIAVRANVARILAERGNKKIYNKLSQILQSDDEFSEVKHSILEGLGKSNNPDKIPLLMDITESTPELEKYITRTLTNRMSPECIKALAEELKNRKERTREVIKQAFKAQGELAENNLLELLKQDIGGIKPIINQLLEDTGLIDIYINRLNNRNNDIRKEAAKLLSKIGTEHALRGLVLAAADPEEDIRIITIKAIAGLEGKNGKDILDRLLSDPNKKVRKYTRWALERKKLENKA